MKVALIGDLVASRSFPSRGTAQRALEQAMATVNDRIATEQIMEATIGDEFQAVFADPVSAIRATFLTRILLPWPMDARFGIGFGDLDIVGATRYGLTQDGPAWWHARSAIDDVKQAERRLPAVRARIVAEPTLLSPMVVSLMNAYLIDRDQIMGTWDERQRRLAAGLVTGRTQRDLAESESITPSAVSQSVRRSGLAAVIAAEQELVWQ